MFRLDHSNGPAPAYTIESDSEDDRWDEDLTNPRGIKDQSNQLEKSTKETEKLLEWEPNRPQLKFDSKSNLLVLIGDPGILVGSGFSEQFITESEPFNQLDRFVLVSDSGGFALSPAHIPLQLQTRLARKLLSDLKPPSLIIISSYPAPTYIPASDQPPIRYLASSKSSNQDSTQTLEKLGCHHFQVPNLIKGFEAALMIQATIMKMESTIILLPAISRPHDQKSSRSIPTGQYDFSTVLSDHDLPSSLLSIEDRILRTTIKSIIDQLFLNHHQTKWQFPTKLNPSLKQIFKMKFNLDVQLKPKPDQNDYNIKDISLMYL